jgi:hypothetical protein
MTALAQAHADAKAEALELLAEITQSVQAHTATNWAHVGDVTRALAALRELSHITAEANRK